MSSALETRDFATKIAEVSARVESLRREQLTLQAQEQAAQQECDRALARLRTDYGVESLAAARDLLVDLDRQISEELAIVHRQLAEAEDVS